MSNCLFCNEQTADDIPYQNDFFYLRFDRRPVTPGHSLIIPKKHILSLLDLTREEWAELYPFLKQSLEVIEQTNFKKFYENQITQREATDAGQEFWKKMITHPGIDKKPDGYNFGNNDGAAAGRTIHHLHIHIIPRYLGDVPEPRGGIRHIIPGMGGY